MYYSLKLNQLAYKNSALLKLQQNILDNGMAFIFAFIAIGISAPVLAEDLSNSTEMETASSPQPQTSSDAVEIEGDKLNLYLDRKMRASGNAVIRKGNQQISGDNIEYDVQDDELTVTGNAVINVGDSKITGPELHMRLSESIGEMREASVVLKNTVADQSQPNLIDNNSLSVNDPKLYTGVNNNLSNISEVSSKLEGSRGDAKRVLFEGQDKKHLKDARFTTCPAGVDDWYIKAKDLELDDYTKSGVAKNAYVEFKGVPLLYTPWLSFSFNNQRKSGLLSPTFGTTSRGGFELSTPFYWNIRPDMDATLATRYMSKRGLQLQGEYRYLDETYSGLDNLEYLNNDSITDESRFLINLVHRHYLGEGWTAGFNIERVSDDKYFSELSTSITSTSRVNLPQGAFIDYQDETWHLNGLVEKYQNLDNVSFAYERLPQMTLTANKLMGKFNTDLFTQWTYFDRDADAPKVATGSRLVINPSVSLPMTTTYGYITPKIGLHASSYNLSNNNFIVNGNNVSNNNQNVFLPMLSVDSGLYFDAENTYSGTSYTQTIEPRLFYVYIPYKNQSQLPTFDTALADLNLTSLFTENQFTGPDRINNANQVSLALTTRLIDSDTGIERIAATIGERFYFDDQKVALPNLTASKRNTSDIVAGFTARLSSKWNLDAFWQYNPDANSLERSNILARYNPEPGKLLNVGYRYTGELLEQLDASGQWPLGNGWYGVGRINYSVRDSKPIETLFGLEYDTGCWQARTVIQRLETATANANYALFFQLELGGLASIGSNPLSILRRDIPGYLTSGQIPNFYRQQNSTQ